MKLSFLSVQILALLAAVFVAAAQAQGPAPETAPPLFPNGALVSYGSYFNTRGSTQNGSIYPTSTPTFSHEGIFVFTWGFHPDFDLTVDVPIVTTRYNSRPEVGGTGPGDLSALVKYRFYRHDSQRGTTQASVTAGPKLPTGETGLTDSSGNLLPVSLQPGSGSTDAFVGMNWTYTGLFGIKRLVADADIHELFRTVGARETQLGSEFESRFWLSYRPYESSDVNHEWFIGPTMTWLNSQDEQIAGEKQNGSGGNILFSGVTTYVGVAAGFHAWLALDWAVTHSMGEHFTPDTRHISFGITKQFLLF